jgi:hypothetical protein
MHTQSTNTRTFDNYEIGVDTHARHTRTHAHTHANTTHKDTHTHQDAVGLAVMDEGLGNLGMPLLRAYMQRCALSFVHDAGVRMNFEQLSGVYM